MRYVTELLGIEATRWEFGRAIVRDHHVSTMFVCNGAPEDALELWVSATNQESGGWSLQHTQLPRRPQA